MLDLILKRRSVRQYLKKEVEETVLKDILSAGLLAPTGMNKKPCRFYVIKKKPKLSIEMRQIFFQFPPQKVRQMYYNQRVFLDNC